MGYFKNYLIAFAFICFTLRLVAVGASYGDALALIALAALKGFELWLEHIKVKSTEKETKEELLSHITQLRADLQQEIQNTKDKVATIQLSSGLMPRSNGR